MCNRCWCDRVALHATHKNALNVVGFKDLKRFAAEPEAANVSTYAQEPGDRSDKLAKRSTELSGHMGGKRTEDAVEGPLVAGSRGYN